MGVILPFLLLGGIVACYFYRKGNYNYWSNRGIPCASDVLPVLGNMWPVVSLRMSFADFAQDMYNRYSGRSLIGFYNKTTPALLIRDPKLVRTILSTDFASFSENLLKVDPHLDPLFSVNPFFANGDTWLKSRKRLSRAFSSNRLKVLYSSVNQVCKKFEIYMDQRLERNDGTMDIELRDLFSKYTGEIVANASLGVEGYCFDDESHSASFVKMGKLIFDPTYFSKIVQTLNFFLPSLNKVLRIPFVPEHVNSFFRDTVKEVLRARRQENERRNDFLQLMVDLERTEGEQIDEELLAAHAFSFFADGYDTSSITLSFLGYQLAKHPDIQERLRDEVKYVLAKYDGQMTYESLNEMSYMDQVIKESQRHYNSSGVMGKICTKEYELVGSDGLRCRVQPGTEILISVLGLHRDSRYWRSPNVFDPDRFAADRKTEIEKYAFLPFSEGPRMCVGMRMALLQVKACLATIIKSFTIEIATKTREPLKIEPGSFLTAVVGGLWVHIRRL